MYYSVEYPEGIMSPRNTVSTLLSLMILMLLLVSCSSGSGGSTQSILPDVSSPHAANSSPGACLGAFRIIPADDLSSAEIVPIRSPQFDVTQWAQVEIIDMVWDPVLRNWTLTVQVSNPTKLSAWGVRAIFTDLGGKELRWPDGFTWLDLVEPPGPERYPFFAIEKTTPDRIFEGYHTSTQDLTFHFPYGVEKWIPMEFFLDANLFEPRPDPMVEDMNMGYFPPPCMHATVLATIGDHQSDTGELEVWVDLTSLGGSPQEPMFDDGEHDDWEAGDGIFGAQITDGNFGELYELIVYASDPEANFGENDIFYSPIGYPPLPPIAFETMFQDILCLLEEETLEVIRTQDEWDYFWEIFTPWDMPPPEVDFETKNVIAVCIGTRPDDCYSVEITGINWSSENCGWAVHYTETYPGPDCLCGDMVTSPFHLVTVNKTQFDIMFVGDTWEDPCTGTSDPCLDLFELASGDFSNQPLQTTTVIYDAVELADWWEKNLGSDVPEVDFDSYMVIAVTMGGQSSSGHYPTIDSACVDLTEMLEITVGWHYPGPGCMTLPVMTAPYSVFTAEKVGNPYFWTTYDDIYEC